MWGDAFDPIFSPAEARRFCFASISVPTALMIAGTVASAGAAAVGTMGAIKAGEAQKEAADYNANVAKTNAAIANQNAVHATQAGEEQAAMREQRTRATIGAIKANQAAGNIDVNSGSAVDVRSSAAALGELDAINIRANAARQAYGYQTQGASFTAQGQQDITAGENAETAGEIGAASTFLGGTGNAAENWARFQQMGGFNASSVDAPLGYAAGGVT